MKNYSVTIGYKSVISINVKAKSEQEAKDKSLEIFNKERQKPYSNKNMNLEDDEIKVAGILNLDESFNLLNN